MLQKALRFLNFGIIEYYVQSESGCMISLWVQAHYMHGLPKYLRLIYAQGVHKFEGYKGIFIYNFHDNNDSFADINFKEDTPCCQKAEPVGNLYINYIPTKNLAIHEARPRLCQ